MIAALLGAWNAVQVSRLTGRVTVQTVLMVFAGRAASTAGGSLPPAASRSEGGR